MKISHPSDTSEVYRKDGLICSSDFGAGGRNPLGELVVCDLVERGLEGWKPHWHGFDRVECGY